MAGQGIELRLKRGPADPPENDPTFQAELNDFTEALRDSGVAYSQRGMAFDSADAHGYPLAEFVIKELGVPAIGALAALSGAWIAARLGRKVRVKAGEIEVEAHTEEEVQRLLDRAVAIQDRDKANSK